jgi:hypothetical protein
MAPTYEYFSKYFTIVMTRFNYTMDLLESFTRINAKGGTAQTFPNSRANASYQNIFVV